MFHPTVVEASIQRLYDHWQPGHLPEYLTPAQSDELARRLSSVVDDEGNAMRALTVEEQRLVINEKLICKCDFRYWAERYAKINRGGSTIGSMYPLLQPQRFILDRVAELELASWQDPTGKGDGVLVNVLKGSRQIGGSTIAEAVAAYKMTQHTNVYGLIAADVPAKSGYLFGMFELMVDSLPWWLRPEVTEHVKNAEIVFNTRSHLWVEAGKSTRGKEGARGQLGRAMTLSFTHLSELSTWENPWQIDDSFMWTLPRHWRTFAMFESTAKGRGEKNWWHQHWRISKEGKGRFKPIFIPWYSAPEKYSIPAPVDWSPSQDTLNHARLCEQVGPRWTGKPVQLTKDQLYWYESSKAVAVEKDALSSFIEEVGAADDEETFQHSGKSIFGNRLINELRLEAKPIVGLMEVAPWRELR